MMDIQPLSGSDGSVTQQVIEAQSRRIEAQLAANAKEPLVVWDGDGRVKPVGANSGYRPRGVQANSGLGKGDPVQLNGGLVSATPSAGNTAELSATLKGQAEQLAKLAKNLAGQSGAGDPNNETVAGIKDVLPRYPKDTFFDKDSGTLFEWDDDAANSYAAPKWVPLYQIFQGAFSAPDSGNADALAATVYVDGAIAINADGQIYLGETTTPGWTMLAGGGVLSLTTDPTTAGTPVQDNLLVINKTNGDQYYADDSSPQVWVKQPSGGGGFDGIVFYHDALNVSVSFGQFALSTLNLSSWTIGVNTGTYWSAGNPTRIVLPVGLFELSFHACVQNAESIDSITHWRIEAALRSAVSTNQKLFAADKTLTVPYTSGGNFPDNPSSNLATNLTLSVQFYNPTAGWWLEFEPAQYSAFEGFGGLEDAGALSLGNNFPASICIEKLA